MGGGRRGSAPGRGQGVVEPLPDAGQRRVAKVVLQKPPDVGDQVENGAIRVPETPGLGVELVKDEVARYPSVRNVSDPPADNGRAYVEGTADEAVHVQMRMARARRLRR